MFRTAVNLQVLVKKKKKTHSESFRKNFNKHQKGRAHLLLHRKRINSKSKTTFTSLQSTKQPWM